MARPAAIPVRVDMALFSSGVVFARNSPADTAALPTTAWS